MKTTNRIQRNLEAIGRQKENMRTGREVYDTSSAEHVEMSRGRYGIVITYRNGRQQVEIIDTTYNWAVAMMLSAVENQVTGGSRRVIRGDVHLLTDDDHTVAIVASRKPITR